MKLSREWLKKLRLEQSLNHEGVANAANIHRAYYTMIESGHRTPSVEVAKRIAAVLGFPWTRFFEDEPEPRDQAVNL